MRLRRFSRSPLAFWLALATLVVLTWSVIAGMLGRAQAQADRFGSVRNVVVVTRALEIGAVVAPGDVGLRETPAAFVPAGWLGTTDEAVARTTVSRLFPGQVLLREQLAPAGLKGVAALLPPGTRAVAVPTGAATAPLQTGDLVEVLATFDPSVASGQEPTFAVARNALVVDVGADAATVAVGPEEAKRVAFAVTQGSVTLAVAAPGSADAGGQQPDDP